MNKSVNRKWIYGVCRGAFLIYVFFIIYVLFFSERYGRTVPHKTIQYNLVPFAEIRRYIVNLDCFTVEQFMINLAGNLFMFVPFGALMFVWKGKPVSFLYVTMHSLVLSLMIETIQLFTRVGVFDVDDIMLNTVGGMLGFFIYLIARTLVRRMQIHDKK